MKSENSRFVVLGLVSIAAVTLRMLPLVREGSQWALVPDSDLYLRLADGLRSGCGFAAVLHGKCGSPEVLRTPGYPLFLTLMSSSRWTVAAQV
jgi:hypothetical protein